jgi:pyruvate, water dikinase
MAAIAWLTETGRGDAPVVGGKAANLGELMRLGLPVPAGFVVTVEAYLHAMEDGGVRDELRDFLAEAGREVEDPVVLGASAERMRALVRKAGIPAGLRDEVLDAYHRLGGGVAVAVRSSAHGEDTTDASFAGMYDTYLNVVGDEELLDRVIDCWVSLYGERVIAYRRALTLDAEPAMAVVVQVLVDADRAGVMFTADPSTREEDSLIIEAGFGLGEVLNGGEVEPDTYTVSKRTTRVRQVWVGCKSHKAVPREAGGVARIDLGHSESRSQVLTDDQVIALAQLGSEVEGHYGGTPQDIEWAIQDGSMFVVQTRPLTAFATSSQASPLGAVGRKLLHGLAAAPGVATGHVRILMSPEHWRRVNPGDVVVAPMTNPDWLPAIRRSAALVTDGGGITCHGAIVARELRVPCVVATRVGTTLLRDGEVVTVDGTGGVVLAGNHAAETDS